MNTQLTRYATANWRPGEISADHNPPMPLGCFHYDAASLVSAVVNPNHALPKKYEWNAALDGTLGTANVLTVVYLGATARKLMRQDIYDGSNTDFPGEVDLMPIIALIKRAGNQHLAESQNNVKRNPESHHCLKAGHGTFSD